MAGRKPSIFTIILAIIWSQGITGVGAALTTTALKLQLRGRGACRIRGLLSAAAECGGNSRITLSTRDTGTGLQHWQVTPVRAGPIEGVPVFLQVGGRKQCAAFAAYPANCKGEVTLQRLAGSRLQHFVLKRQADGSYSVAPFSCPDKLLGFARKCSSKMVRLVKPGKGATAWTVAAVVSPSPPPLPPPPSPPPPSPPPPPRPPSPPPPSPSPPPFTGSPGPGNSPATSPPPVDPPTPGAITATAVKLSEWNSGFEGAFRIANGKDYTLLVWELNFSFSDNFTWGPSEADVEWSGNSVTLRPKDWNAKIAPGATLSIGFGGRSQLPSDFVFNLHLPQENPQADPSLQARGQMGEKVFAPYIDIMAWPIPQLRTGVVAATGHLFYRLAFITAKVTAEGARPAWAGVTDLEELFFYDQVRQLRLLGGDVIVSFGGANGQELAQAIKDEDALVAAYQKVIDTYFLRWVDFDIEGGAVADKESVDRRNRAIARLQAANPGLTVSYCLPVLPAGLTADGVALLASAKARGVRIDEISVMAMDYGDSAAPDPQGRMGYYAKQAAINTRAQALSVGLPDTTKIGIIPMIGVNDVLSEVFTLADACEVAAFAQATSWVRTTSMWSVNRDNYKGNTGAVPDSSGIPQEAYAFNRIFAAGAAGGTAPACVGGTTKSTGRQLPALEGPLSGVPGSQLARVEKVAYRHNWRRWTETYPGSNRSREARQKL